MHSIFWGFYDAINGIVSHYFECLGNAIWNGMIDFRNLPIIFIINRLYKNIIALDNSYITFYLSTFYSQCHTGCVYSGYLVVYGCSTQAGSTYGNRAGLNTESAQ